MPAAVTSADFARALGVQLARARRAAGLTQADMHVRLGVSERTVRLWESGSVTAPAHQVDAWCRTCGIGIEINLHAL